VTDDHKQRENDHLVEPMYDALGDEAPAPETKGPNLPLVMGLGMMGMTFFVIWILFKD
jgi:hypothetical protein